MERINVTIDETGKPESKEEENKSMEQLFKEEDEKEVEEEDEDEENSTEVEEKVQQVSPKTPRKRVQKNHPSNHIIGNKDAGVETRRKIRSPEQTHLALLSTIEPNCFEESSMDEELDQIEKNDTWEQVPRPKNKNVIGTKWVFRNKLNEDEQVQGTKLDWYVKDMHRLKESTLKRHLSQLPEWKQSICFWLMHAPRMLKYIRWT